MLSYVARKVTSIPQSIPIANQRQQDPSPTQKQKHTLTCHVLVGLASLFCPLQLSANSFLFSYLWEAPMEGPLGREWRLAGHYSWSGSKGLLAAAFGTTVYMQKVARLVWRRAWGYAPSQHRLPLLPSLLPLLVFENVGELLIVEPCKGHPQKLLVFLRCPCVLCYTC